MRKFLIILILISPAQLWAQNTEDEQADLKRIWNVELSGSYDLSLGSMAERYGNSFRLGGGISVKTKKNWVFGGQFLFLLGGQVIEPGLLSNMGTSQNGVISKFGEVIKVEAFQRGYMVGLHAGKVFPMNDKNLHSGITTITGVGFMQHKINIFDRSNSLAQLDGELKKGYDRLANGIYFRQFLGYTFYHPNKLINFRAGIDFNYAPIQGRRNWWYDVDQSGFDQRNDMLLGASFSWLIPLYEKNVEETYY